MMNLAAEHESLPSYLESLKAEAAQMQKRLDELKEAATIEDAEAYDSIKGRIAEIEEMNKEFGFDAVKGREKIIAEEAVPDFKPILGCEVYVARNGMLSKSEKSDQSGWHLILLAKNLKGYKNLIKIVSKAWTDGYYYRPRTDRAELQKYHEGIICCSACLGGEVPKRINEGDIAAAEEAILWHKNLFGDD